MRHTNGVERLLEGSGSVREGGPRRAVAGEVARERVVSDGVVGKVPAGEERPDAGAALVDV